MTGIFFRDCEFGGVKLAGSYSVDCLPPDSAVSRARVAGDTVPVVVQVHLSNEQKLKVGLPEPAKTIVQSRNLHDS